MVNGSVGVISLISFLHFSLPESYTRIREARPGNPKSEWTPFWEYGAFIDVRDAASAALCALDSPNPGYATALICAEDISSADKTSLELVKQIYPDIPWRGGEEYHTNSYLALVKTERARSILGCQPKYQWRS